MIRFVFEDQRREERLLLSMVEGILQTANWMGFIPSYCADCFHNGSNVSISHRNIARYFPIMRDTVMFKISVWTLGVSTFLVS
jgi:hypothetical protein